MSRAFHIILDKWAQDHGHYPTTEEQLVILEKELTKLGVHKRRDGQYYRDDVDAALKRLGK